MHKTLRVMVGVAVLGASLSLAAPGHAQQAAPVTPMMGNGAMNIDCKAMHEQKMKECKKNKKCVAMHKKEMNECTKDPACLSMHDSMKKECGKDQKCVAKHENMKKDCPMMTQKPAVLPYYAPQQGVQPRPMMQGMAPKAMGMNKPVAMEPHPTGRATGVSPVPNSTYMLPAMQ